MNRRLTAILAAIVFAGGCASDSQVGSQDNLGFKEQQGGRVGAIERSTAPVRTATPKPATRRPTTAPTRPAPSPTRTAARRSPRPPAAAFTIKIVATGQGFDPFNFAVTKGTRVKVLNTDSTARTFTSDVAGEFDSGPLAPGDSFIYTAVKVGAFNFHDQTRPFAVGRMEVRG